MKRFIVPSSLLKSALKKLALAIPDKPTLPALSNVLCKVNNRKVEMITTNLNTTICYTLEADTEGEFDIMIPFERLKRTVAQIKSAPVTIELLSPRKGRIIGDIDVHELNSLAKPDDFPKIPTTPKKHVLTLPEDFIKTLDKAMLTVGKDEMRPALTMACLDIRPDEVNLVSTDAHTLFIKKIDVEGGTEEQLLFPTELAEILAGSGNIELSWTKTQIAFKTDTLLLWSRRHEHKYPDYRSIIPSITPNTILERSQLADALNRCTLSSLGTKHTTLELTKEKGFLHLFTNDPDYEAVIRVKIESEYTGQRETIYVSSAKMLVIMGQTDANRIRLHIGSIEKQAILISSDEDPGYLGLLMPLVSE